MAGIFDLLDLTPSQRLFSEFIPGMLRQGLSANSILAQAKANGIGIRRTTALSLIRYAQGTLSAQKLLGFISNTSIINPDIIPPATSNLARNYHVTISGDVYDPETDTYETRYVTFATDTLGTKQDLLDRFSTDAATILLTYSEATGNELLDVQNLQIHEILKSPTL